MKKQSESTFLYIMRNMLSLLVIAIIPSILLGVFSTDHFDFSYVNDYLANPSTETFDGFVIGLMQKFSIINVSHNWLWFLLSGLVYVYAMSVISVKVQKHMRLGVNTMSFSLLARALELFPFALLYAIVNILASEIFTFLGIGMVLFLQNYLSVNEVIIVGFVLQVVLKIAFLSIAALFVCAIPSLSNEGFALNIAANYSVKIVSRYYKQVVCSILASYIVSMLFQYGIALLGPEFSMLSSSFYYLWWAMMLPCYGERIYAKFEEVERKDLKRKY